MDLNSNLSNEKYCLRSRSCRLHRNNGIIGVNGSVIENNQAKSVNYRNIDNKNHSRKNSLNILTNGNQIVYKNAAKQSYSHDKSSRKAAPLSKYRRKTANARERSRMREINKAFENLKYCVPHSIAKASEQLNGDLHKNEKLTKITTLRLAMKYIQILSELLKDHQQLIDAVDPFCLGCPLNMLEKQDFTPEVTKNNKDMKCNNAKSQKSKKKTKTNYLKFKSKIIANDQNSSTITSLINNTFQTKNHFFLESDDESLNLTECKYKPGTPLRISSTNEDINPFQYHQNTIVSYSKKLSLNPLLNLESFHSFNLLT